MQWGRQQADMWKMQGIETQDIPLAFGSRSTLTEDKKLAEEISQEELSILKQQCQELRDRINQLEEIIKEQNRNQNEPRCVINGGKTKSNKSKKSKKSKKSNKSKRRK